MLSVINEQRITAYVFWNVMLAFWNKKYKQQFIYVQFYGGFMSKTECIPRYEVQLLLSPDPVLWC